MEVERECAQLLYGLVVVDHDDGHLDEEELVLLVAAVEFAGARCLLLPLLETPVGIDLSFLNDAECKLKFRSKRRQICCVHEALQVPGRFGLPCRLVWHGMEGFLVLLRRLCYPNRLDDQCHEFGRSKAALSPNFNRMPVWIWTLGKVGEQFFSRLAGSGRFAILELSPSRRNLYSSSTCSVYRC